ncbi:hypothetical protein GCM10010441_48450 [Kitasatospora paracochleata]|uniref:ABC-2 type transport system permease protein n=1 Tax=Kitasatospora paracochleata TaxID=58354 RepID=A0ABT1ISA9_9ACTN|nr:hypothetical protein [Kitasatospora paracochleata]MCP2307874.1 hypothetical protein [Kitasatospora paracochleata]
MRVLAYELRRLRGLRSTWLILAAVLLCDAAVAAVLARQVPDGALAVPTAVRSVAAAVPLLPLPIAALGAGALGALSYGHEVRHPGLAASRVAFGRRVGLLVGKSVVIGAVSAALAVVTLLLDAVAVRLALPSSVDPAPAFRPDVFGSDPAGLLAAGAPGRPLLAFALLVVVGGWAGLLTTSLVRSAAAGLLVLCALPVLLEPAVGMILRQAGRYWPAWVRELLPFQYGLDWVRGEPGAAAVGPDPVLFAALAAPVLVLLVAAVLAQVRRRAL